MPKLTERSGKYRRCALSLDELSEELQTTIVELKQYSLADRYAGRVVSQLKFSSFERYLRHLLVFAGFFVNHSHSGIAAHELLLQHLCPHLTEEQFDDLSLAVQRRLQKQHARELEALLNDFFSFQLDFMGTSSPATRANYITVFIWLFRFIYRDHVRTKADYQQFEVARMLNQMLTDALRERDEWRRRDRRAIVDTHQKYPDFEVERTGVEILQQDVTLVLLLETAIRNRWKTFRQPRGIAISLQRFILWFLLSFMPARRQQDIRSLKISNSCQLPCPMNIPEGECIFPLPPTSMREQDGNGYPKDNFLLYV